MLFKRSSSQWISVLIMSVFLHQKDVEEPLPTYLLQNTSVPERRAIGYIDIEISEHGLTMMRLGMKIWGGIRRLEDDE